MTRLADTLRTIAVMLPTARPFALVGGLAVSVRAEPRFTRDVDLAVAVADDADAESLVFALGARFSVVATIEHATQGRLATVRLRESKRAPFVDLLFASCGIEPEVARDATPIEVLGVALPVAATGHLIAMKLVSEDPRRRPRDRQDLVDLAAVADEIEWDRAAGAVTLVEQRGFSRGRDLLAALQRLRAGGDS